MNGKCFRVTYSEMKYSETLRFDVNANKKEQDSNRQLLRGVLRMHSVPISSTHSLSRMLQRWLIVGLQIVILRK